MQTTGLFTIHQFDIHVKRLGEPIYLFPFGDVHRSSPMCSDERWLAYCDWAAQKKNAYFLGMGDYDDLASTTERVILTDKKLHESTQEVLEELYVKHTKNLVKEITFMKGKLIGLIEGNHCAVFRSGITSTQRMADMLNCKYLGVSAFIRLVFQYSTMNTAIDIWAHHGKGAARLIGGSINRVQQMGEAAEADIYLMAHDHKKAVGMTTKLRLSKNNNGLPHLNHRKQLYIRTGSFLRGYEDGRVSYVADGAMNPTDLGVVKIEMTPQRTWKEGRDTYYVDLHASI